MDRKIPFCRHEWEYLGETLEGSGDPVKGRKEKMFYCRWYVCARCGKMRGRADTLLKTLFIGRKRMEEMRDLAGFDNDDP